MISFALDADQELVRETVRKFAADAIRPNLRAWEKAGGVPLAAKQQFHELGLGLIDVPEASGGGGAGLLTAALVHEELAFGDPGAAVALFAPHLAPAAVLELGDEEQARRLLARFAEPAGASRLGAVAWSEKQGAPLEGFATVAEKQDGGWLLHGSKAFVVNGGKADLTIVFAQIDRGLGWRGIGAFAVESPGASTGGALPDGLRSGDRHALLGLETVHAAELVLDGLFVPDGSRLRTKDNISDALARFFARASLINAARQVGLARASYELALEYTQDRHAFGKPVAHFQSIAFTLADMHMDVESARWMVWRAAAAIDRGEDHARLVAEAAAHANEAAFRVADNGVQLLGGAGYIQDFPAEKWLRDTRALSLFAPTDQLTQLAAASATLGHPVGDALPSSAIQPLFL